jgi:hypothetical protein
MVTEPAEVFLSKTQVISMAKFTQSGKNQIPGELFFALFFLIKPVPDEFWKALNSCIRGCLKRAESRHCERSEAILNTVNHWIASGCALAMTETAPF